MANQNEYRATHDEKNLVIKELRLLDGKWLAEKQKALRQANAAASERVSSSKTNLALAAKYGKLKAELDSMEHALRVDGNTFCQNGEGFCVSSYYSDASSKESVAVEKAAAERLDRLSDIRTRIGLSNYRSEVKALYESAMKL